MSAETVNSNFQEVRGKLLTKDDFFIWTPQKFEEFFVFLEFFYPANKWEATEDTIRMVDEYSKSGATCQEFVERIGMSIEGVEISTPFRAKYRGRVFSMARTMRHYLEKISPGALSPITAAKYRYKAQHEWLRELYDDDGKVKFKNQDIDIILPDASKTLEKTLEIADTPMNVRLLGAIEKVITVYETIASSVTLEDIQKMKPMDKISALNKLSYLHQALGKTKIPTKFTQININNASKEDLEASLLDAGQEDL